MSNRVRAENDFDRANTQLGMGYGNVGNKIENIEQGEI
jgi:hypothetical protein